MAHCDTDIEGGYLYMLTLTDVATGWAECLPLLYRSQETVLAAIQQARLLFPFPILGIDTDNGGEFINYVHAGTPVLEKRSVLCRAEKWRNCAPGGGL